jgi:hypothetical protein
MEMSVEDAIKEMVRSRVYWEERYEGGGGSGTSAKNYEWEVIKRHIPEVDHIIDVGCGDLAFWNYKPCPDYVGIDISQQIIWKDMERTRGMAPMPQFICQPAELTVNGLHRENVICMDVLIHILRQDNFDAICQNLRIYAEKRIILTVWDESPFTNADTDGIYQRYFDFKPQIPNFERLDFKLKGNYLIKFEVMNPQPGLKTLLRKRIYAFERPEPQQPNHSS